MAVHSPAIFKISYSASPTLARFHHSRAFVRGVMGPVGSGKSVGCCAELMDIATHQWPTAQGWRKTRFVVVRNTSPQLETTTIKTWTEWFPEEIFGSISRKPPFTQMIRFPMNDGTRVECEVIFLALDKPEDVKKLLSLECTAIWYNEAREIEKVLIDAGTGRVGRFPSFKDKPEDMPAGYPWPTRACIIMDTNPPPDDHWWYDFAENDGWRRDVETGTMRELEGIPEDYRWEFFRQPGGRSPLAENLANLPPGYYQRQMMGKGADYIRVMVDGEYGILQAGKPVFKDSFNKSIHVAPLPLPIDPHRFTVVGVDSSGRNPSAVFVQRNDDGQVQVVHELVCEDMGAELFAKLLKAELQTKFRENERKGWGDPAGANKQSGDERTYFDIVKQYGGIQLFAAPNALRLAPRLEAVRSMFLRLGLYGRPAILISPSCKKLVAGLSGAYKFRQLQVSGEARFNDEPEKNRYSDVQDALQYAMCGMGEYKTMLGRNAENAQQPNRSAVDLGGSEWNP